MKHPADVASINGHVNAEHRMNRKYLEGRLGNGINAVLAVAGYDFRPLLRWLAELFARIRTFVETVPAQNIA